MTVYLQGKVYRLNKAASCKIFSQCQITCTPKIQGMKKSTFRSLYIRGGSFSKMADKDGRNFRAFYYDTLGLRNVELKKALEILLKDDPIGSVK